jgi:hypothetical protein
MGELLLGVLKELLHAGNLTLEEKHLYEDNVLKLEKEWYEEYDKLETELGSDNALDDVERKLRLTTKALVETLRSKHS